MAALVWDEPEDKIYQTGVDKVVLYHQFPPINGAAWNGVTEIAETSRQEVEDVYFNGVKVYGITKRKDYSAEISAFSYPEELFKYSGNQEMSSGFYLGDQRPALFNMSYRTLIGSPTEGEEFAYKIHMVWNVLAVPKGRSSDTIGDSTDPVLFSWDIQTSPQQVYEPTFKYRPTSYMAIDSRKINATKLEELELMLYGGDDPAFAWIWQVEPVISLLTN